MSWTKDWKKAFKNARKKKVANKKVAKKTYRERMYWPFDSSLFGSNCWTDDDDVVKYLSKLERLGADVELDADYWSSVRVHLPTVDEEGYAKMQSEILLCIITKTPIPTDVSFNKKKNYLELTWS